MCLYWVLRGLHQRSIKMSNCNYLKNKSQITAIILRRLIVIQVLNIWASWASVYIYIILYSVCFWSLMLQGQYLCHAVPYCRKSEFSNSVFVYSYQFIWSKLSRYLLEIVCMGFFLISITCAVGIYFIHNSSFK